MKRDESTNTNRALAALRRRMLAALADAGFGRMVPASAVNVTEEGVSLNMSMDEARWFTNQIEDIAEGVNNPTTTVIAMGMSHQEKLELVFEEVHTTPTGYAPARVFPKVAA